MEVELVPSQVWDGKHAAMGNTCTDTAPAATISHPLKCNSIFFSFFLFREQIVMVMILASVERHFLYRDDSQLEDRQFFEAAAHRYVVSTLVVGADFSRFHSLVE